MTAGATYGTSLRSVYIILSTPCPVLVTPWKSLDLLEPASIPSVTKSRNVPLSHEQKHKTNQYLNNTMYSNYSLNMRFGKTQLILERQTTHKSQISQKKCTHSGLFSVSDIAASCPCHPALLIMCCLILKLELDEGLRKIPQRMHGSVLFVLFTYPKTRSGFGG